MVAYDSSHTYDFGSALASAKTAELKTSGLSANERWWRQQFDALTEATLRRDAQRFGSPEDVAEIAEIYGNAGLAVELRAGNGSKRRPMSPAMVEQVRALRERGLVPSAIADALNLSDRRVTQLLAQSA